jgi:hypothetical protein
VSPRSHLHGWEAGVGTLCSLYGAELWLRLVLQVDGGPWAPKHTSWVGQRGQGDLSAARARGDPVRTTWLWYWGPSWRLPSLGGVGPWQVLSSGRRELWGGCCAQQTPGGPVVSPLWVWRSEIWQAGQILHSYQVSGCSGQGHKGIWEIRFPLSIH